MLQEGAHTTFSDLEMSNQALIPFKRAGKTMPPPKTMDVPSERDSSDGSDDADKPTPHSPQPSVHGSDPDIKTASQQEGIVDDMAPQPTE